MDEGYQQIVTGSFHVKGDFKPHDPKTCDWCRRLANQMEELIFRPLEGKDRADER